MPIEPPYIPRTPRMSHGSTTKSRMRNVLHSIALCVISIIVLSVAGFDIWLASDTLINGWIPLGICAMISIYGAIMLHSRWKWLTQSSTKWINILCGIAVTTPLLLLAFYGTNWLGASPDKVHTEEVTVESRYYKERHRTRRVGRRYVADGEPYKVYYATVVFPDGFKKEISLTHSRYRRIHQGQHLSVEVTTGLWGVRVIKNISYD